MKNMRRVILITLGILALLVVQGLGAMGDDISETDLTTTRDTLDLNSKKIYGSSNNLQQISVYGARVAWSERIDTSNTTTYDVVAYDSGNVKNYHKDGESQMRPSVGSKHIVWESWPENSKISIDSDSGVVYSSSYDCTLPRTYGDEVAFLEESLPDRVVYMPFGGSPTKISTNTTINFVSISANYIGFGPFIYSKSNGTMWQAIAIGEIYGISGNWVLYGGRSNFGKSVYMYVTNIKTGETHSVVSYDTGYYDGIDSMAIDGYWVAWSYEGTGYLYNILSGKTYTITNGEVDDIAVGGGSVAWIDYTKKEVWLASLPSTGSYVEVTLKDPSTHTDTSFHQLLVIDAQGRKFGGWNDATNDIYREIPGAVVIENWNVKKYRIPTDSPDSLQYKIIAKHDGKYSFYVEKVGTAGRADVQCLWVNATDISVKTNEINLYIINWEKVASNAADSVTLKIDENGDGTYDKEITASNHITEETVENGGSGTLPGVMGLPFLAIVGIAAIAVIIVVVVAMKKSKK